MRAGTENVAAIVGMAAALKNNVDRIREVTKHLQQLEQALLDALDNAKIDYVRNGENHLPGNLSLSFKGANGETLLHRLDLMGIKNSESYTKNSNVKHSFTGLKYHKNVIVARLL